MLKTPVRILSYSFFLCSLGLLVGCRPTASVDVRQGGGVGAPAPAVLLPGADRALTDTARVLAGMSLDPSSPLAPVAAKPEWRAWQKEFDTQWTQATTERFVHMAAWRDQELKAVTGDCSTLMYPFSGPDILNAWLLFPDCRRYVLFGLEQPGSLPPLEQLPADRLARLLDETRNALNDLLARNYFITKHMLRDT